MPKAVIVISHDKAFVDNLTNEPSMNSRWGASTITKPITRIICNYGKKGEQQQKQFNDQQKEIADITAFIERFKGTYSKTLQVQSRVKMLEKIEIVQIGWSWYFGIESKVPSISALGSYPVIVETSPKIWELANGAERCIAHHCPWR